jgi:gentisate 1,2-dioxygenase
MPWVVTMPVRYYRAIFGARSISMQASERHSTYPKSCAVTKNWCFSELLPHSERASSIFTTAAARDKVLNINPLKVYNAGSSLKQKHFEPHT